MEQKSVQNPMKKKALIPHKASLETITVTFEKKFYYLLLKVDLGPVALNPQTGLL